MDDLLKLALMFVTESHGHPRGGGNVTRMTAAAFCTAFAVVTITAGMACGVAALWIYLAPLIGAAGAALSAAGVFLVLSGILMFVARNMFRPVDSVAVTGEPVTEEIAALLRTSFGRHKGATLLTALVAGIAAGSARK